MQVGRDKPHPFASKQVRIAQLSAAQTRQRINFIRKLGAQTFEV
jgi:hypothetical protein